MRWEHGVPSVKSLPLKPFNHSRQPYTHTTDLYKNSLEDRAVHRGVDIRAPRLCRFSVVTIPRDFGDVRLDAEAPRHVHSDR